MENKIATVTDAERVIGDWTEIYLVPPTPAQVRAAAYKLVDHIGGYGNYADGDTTADFDLDAALEEE